ncbi:MAG: PEP-CTERM sorting domain-containing protein, partial [Merismopedia sp. SIO2A8]|nr:PEP-CTERM sorting domain-containing protein [Merismopedia sp. SIO2A8]
MAMREDSDRLYFAFNTNLSQNGLFERYAWDSRISYGDFFLNFANPSSFDDANGQLYAIHFNDNDNFFRGMEWGLYENVQAGELVLSNANAGVLYGDGSLQQTQAVIEAEGGSVSYGDLASDTDYLDLTQAAPTMIQTGTKIGDIDTLDADALATLQLDFGYFNATGTETFGFSVERDLLPSTEFIAHLFIDSGNEGIALQGNLGGSPSWADPGKKIPEPGSVVGLGLVGLLMWRWRQIAQATL